MSVEKTVGSESKSDNQLQHYCGKIAAEQISTLSNLAVAALDPSLVEGVGPVEDQRNYVKSIAIILQGFCTSLAGQIYGATHDNKNGQHSPIAFQITSLGDAAYRSLFHSGIIPESSVDQQRAYVKQTADDIKVFCNLIAGQLLLCAQEGSSQ